MKIVESEYWEEALRSCHVVEDSSNPEVPPVDVNHPAPANPEVPPIDVNHPAPANPEVPPADVNHPAAANQEVPPIDVNHPATANQEVPPTQDNLKYHLTETTPMRELIKEMPGIVFTLLENAF